MIPLVNLLYSVTGCYANTVVLKTNLYILRYDPFKTLLLNTQFLLKLDLPHSQIMKLLTSFGPALSTPHDKFRNIVLKLEDMGFDLNSSYFCNALSTLCSVTDLTLECKCVLFRSFGFSDHEILSMFKKLPKVMCFNETTLTEKLEFFSEKIAVDTV